MLSVVSKLDGIKSWSLRALETCPGARDEDGDIVPVCQGCYAREGNYRFPNVIAHRVLNRIDWDHDDWVPRMVAALGTERYFRWFDSGDVYCVGLAEKIEHVIRDTPWCKHWLPTRSYKFDKIDSVLDRIRQLPNAVVRNSADNLNERAPGTHSSMVVTDREVLSSDVHYCPAYETKPAKCNGCRACWDPEVKVIAYPAHGQAMKRVVRQNSPSSIRSTVSVVQSPRTTAHESKF